MGNAMARADAAPGTLAAAGRLEELYVRDAPAALRLAFFLTGDRELAQDLVQDAFVKIAGRFGHLRQPDAFEAYLRRTIVNLFTSHLRRLRLERAELARERVERPLDPVLEDAVEHDGLVCALRHLPVRQRAAVVLRFCEDLPEREAADMMRCSTSALNSLVSRAMVSLRNELRGWEP
ncbi:MAG TPA: sigma-70 family RNA polymerase sigma factor [Actinomycetota bacterium]|nr:sigma-70 family RNA polymerase sigma factor [Actinomycetota bacterium]